MSAEVFDQMVDAVEGLIRRSLAPIADEVRDLEQWRKTVGEARGPAGQNGKDGVQGIEGKQGQSGRDGKDGADGIPGRDGKDGSPGLTGKDGAVGRDGKDGFPGADGKEGPAGRDGKDGKDGKDGRDGDRGADGEKGLPGLDGVGVDRMEVDQRSVEFILTDGRSARVELPLGPRGDSGQHGERGERGEKGDKGDSPSLAEIESIMIRWLPDMVHKAIESAMQRMIPEIVAKAVALVPPGRDGLSGAPGRPGTPGEDGIDGKDGTPGRDGFGIDDLELNVKEDGRTVVVTLSNDRKKVSKEIRLAVPIHKGVYRNGTSYQRGDAITYGGSAWLAKRDTVTSPPGDDWQLIVKGAK